MSLQVSPSLFVLLVFSVFSCFPAPSFGTPCPTTNSADIVLAIADSKETAFRSKKNGLRLSNGLSRFIKTFISQCDFSKNRLAIMAFSDSVRTISPFSRKRSALRKSRNSWIPESGDVATDLALLSIGDYFTAKARPTASKVLVLVTPQSSEDSDLATSEAQLLRDDGVNIIGVGYGRNRPSVSELVSLTADPGLVFLTRVTKHLPYTVSLIEEAICTQIQEQGPEPAGQVDTPESNSEDSNSESEENSESSESDGNSESSESDDNSESSESDGNSESEESDGNSESSESDGTSESEELNIPEVSTIDPMEPMSTTDPMEPMSTTDSMEPMSTTDPMEPMSTTDPMEPMPTTDTNY